MVFSDGKRRGFADATISKDPAASILKAEKYLPISFEPQQPKSQ
jgi:hypothetical protein